MIDRQINKQTKHSTAEMLTIRRLIFVLASLNDTIYSIGLHVMRRLSAVHVTIAIAIAIAIVLAISVVMILVLILWLQLWLVLMVMMMAIVVILMSVGSST